MPYDFTFVNNAIKKCGEDSNWRDRHSEKLERDYLLPLEHYTSSLSSLAFDLWYFMQNAADEFDEIKKSF